MEESRYTPSNDFCLHPEYWHSPDSEATEYEVSEFIGALIRILQPEFVLETGTYHGHTAWEITKNLYENGHGELHSLENDKKAHNIAKSHLDELAYQYFNAPYSMLPVKLILQNTMEYIPEKNIDFAFFDSWQEGRHEEFLRFYNMGKLRPGAMVAFHDTAPHHQVLKHVRRLEDDRYIKSLYFRTPRGLALAVVL